MRLFIMHWIFIHSLTIFLIIIGTYVLISLLITTSFSIVWIVGMFGMCFLIWQGCSFAFLLYSSSWVLAKLVSLGYCWLLGYYLWLLFIFILIYRSFSSIKEIIWSIRWCEWYVFQTIFKTCIIIEINY